MGQSTPTRQLYCSKCKDTWQRKYQMSGFSPEYRRWFNVAVVEDRGEKAFVRCLSCGHQYLSGSVAAQRGLNALRKRKREE